MSAPTQYQSRMASRRPGTAVGGLAGRSRRADAGTVTEMARSLLRDAREARKSPGAGARYTRVPARLERTERLTAVEPAAQAA